MNYLEPIKLNNIDLNKINYLKIKENQNKKIIIIKYNIENNKLINFVFQTPTLINLNKPNICDDYAELDILLDSKSKNLDNFVNFLDKIETKIKNDAKIFASRWFITKNNNEVVNFQKIIRDDNTMKIKLIKNKDFETIVQMNNDTKINFNAIPNNSFCKIILEFYAIWINSNNEFGIFFRPILISFKLRNIYNYKFLESESETDNKSENQYYIQDTDVFNNIFIKKNLPNENNHNTTNDTSQLECNILYNSLIENSINNQARLEESVSDKTSDYNLSKINGNETSSSESNKYNDSNISISSLESLKSTDTK